MRFSALFRLPALAACLALAWPLSPAAAQAQTSPPGGGGAEAAAADTSGIEEIVVTARKREESLQDVPIAISAFPGEELETYQVDNIVDLETLVPNVTLTESGGLATGSLLVFIRGIGSDPGFAQGVGIYTDDVYLNQQSGALLEVLDVERIELLKGPQGHLYGRNTLGGAIRYITRKPGDELRVRFDGGYGRFTEWFARGSISGPISQTLGGSLSLLYRQRDPIQKNTYTTTEEGEFWGADIGAYRASLHWAPSEAVKFALSANLTSDGSEPRVGKRVGVNAAQIAGITAFNYGAESLVPGAGLVPSPNDVLPFGISDHPDRITTEFTAAAGSYPDANLPGAGPRLVGGPHLAGRWSLDDYELDTQSFSLTAEFDLGPSWLLKSVSAYRSVDDFSPFAFDGTEQTFINTIQDRETSDFSQELQLNYTGESVSLVAGIYYLDGTLERGPVAGNITPRLLATSLRETRTTQQDDGIESLAGYVNVDWRMSESWELSLGGRFTRDEVTLTKRSRSTDTIYPLWAHPNFRGIPLHQLPGQGGGTLLDNLIGGVRNGVVNGIRTATLAALPDGTPQAQQDAAVMAALTMQAAVINQQVENALGILAPGATLNDDGSIDVSMLDLLNAYKAAAVNPGMLTMQGGATALQVVAARTQMLMLGPTGLMPTGARSPCPLLLPMVPGPGGTMIPNPLAGSEACPLTAPGTSPLTTTTVTVLDNQDNLETYNNFSPSLRLSWHLDDNTMLYAGFATGYKQGGFNDTVVLPSHIVTTNADGTETLTPVANQTPDKFDEETVASFTLGAKLIRLGGRLRLNAEGFWNDYNDKQFRDVRLNSQTNLLDGGTSNVGEMTTYGVDMELLWLPSENLSLGLNIGWLDYDVDEFINPLTNRDETNDTRLGFSPELTLQGRAAWDIPLGNLGTASLSTSLAWRDEHYLTSPINITNPLIEAYTQDGYLTWNAAIAFRSRDDRWRIAAEGRNLTNKRAVTHVFDVGPIATGGYTLPRTWLFTVGYSY